MEQMDENLDFEKLTQKYLNGEIDFLEFEVVFEEAIEKSIAIDSFELGRLFDRDEKVKNLILEKMNKVMEKLNFREGFLTNNSFFEDKEIMKKYADIFLSAETKAKKEDGTQVTVLYYIIFSKIGRQLDVFDTLQLIAKHMESIINNCDSVARTIKDINGLLEYGSCVDRTKTSEIVDRIDTSLSNNIDEILAKHDWDYFSSEMLRENTSFPKFRSAIKSKGKEAMYRISVGDSAEIEECIELSRELFGEVSEETIATLKFAHYGEEKARVIAIVMKELREKSKGDISIYDIKKCGEGLYCQAYSVGDYVIKLGKRRTTQQITNHRRILQPIIRQKLYGKSGNSRVDEALAYIEVQNTVDADWFKEMETSEVEEILYKIYIDFRKQGLMWTDIKESNVGRLIRPNRINYSYIDTDRTEKELRPTEEATGIKGELEEQDILPEGEYVVIDTDFIFEEGEKSFEELGILARKYEKRYSKEINSEKEYNER